MASDALWPEASICLGAWRTPDAWGGYKELLIRDYTGRHVFISAPSGWGKSYSVFYPTLGRTWSRSVVVFDVKDAIYSNTSGWRSTFSYVLRFAPGEMGTIRWNPLSSVRRDIHAIRDVMNIAEQMPPEEDSDKHWDIVGKSYFGAVALFLLARDDDEQKCLGGVANALADGQQLGEAMMAFEFPDTEIQRFVRNGAKEVWQNPNERYTGSVLSTVASYLIPYRDPILANATRTSDFLASDLMCSDWPVSLYICPYYSDLKRLHQVLKLMFGQIMNELLEREHTDREGNPKRHRLLWALDEFRIGGKLADYAQALVFKRSSGMRSLIGVQSFSQIIELYGRNNDIFNNMRFLSARQNWIDDQRIISDMIGDAPEVRESVSKSHQLGHMGGSTSHGQSIGWRRVMQPADVGRMRDEELLIFGEPKLIKAQRTPEKVWKPLKRPPPNPSETMLPPNRERNPWQGRGWKTVEPVMGTLPPPVAAKGTKPSSRGRL